MLRFAHLSPTEDRVFKNHQKTWFFKKSPDVEFWGVFGGFFGGIGEPGAFAPGCGAAVCVFFQRARKARFLTCFFLGVSVKTRTWLWGVS